MYVTSACSVRSGESPPDADQVARSREAREALEQQARSGFTAMDRLVHREPGDFASPDAPAANYYELTKSWPEMAPERIPARHRPWPEGYRTVCIAAAPGEDDTLSALRPLYSEPFSPASATAPPPIAQKCAIHRYRPPYPERAGKPAGLEESQPGNGAGLVGALLSLLALGVIAS